MVKEGYKETEIGVIPEDWGLISFKECFNILPNNTLPRSVLSEHAGTIKNIHYGDILVRYDSILNCSKEQIPFIMSNSHKKHSLIFLLDGDVVIADTAEDETVGKTVEITNVGEQKIVAGLHTIPCRTFCNDLFVNGWLGYYVNSNIYHNQLLPLITGTKVSAISKSAISETVILVPPLEEQQKIVEALSDMDNLISALEKLIEKKKAIKRGAIHELLTAKKSLSGFKSEKVSVKLSDIAIIKDGTHGTYNRVDNGVYLLSAKNIFNNHMEVTDNESMISFEDYSSIVSNGFPKENDILLSCVGTIGRCCIYTGTPRAAFQRSVAFVRSKNVDVRYLLCLLQSEAIQKQLKESSNASAQGGVYLGALENLNIEIFADINEQKAIANILFDMDIEITALEQKLTKCKKLKQGMMQQLLTGKIRLI